MLNTFVSVAGGLTHVGVIYVRSDSMRGGVPPPPLREGGHTLPWAQLRRYRYRYTWGYRL